MDASLIFDFLEDLESNPKKGMAYSAGLLVLSLLLLFVVPNAILGAYDTATVGTIQQAETKLQQTEARAPSQDWYVEPYHKLDDGRHYQLWLYDAHSFIEGDGIGAHSLYSKAGFGWPASRIRNYESAQAAAQQALTATDSVVALFDRNDNLRQQVVINQRSLTESWNSRNTSQQFAQGRYDREADEFLSVYMNPLAAGLRASETKIQEAGTFIQASAGYMPDFATLSHMGDPQMAQEELDRAQALITEITTLQSQVTSSLDYQVEARDNARNRADQAATAIDQAASHLNSIDSQYHWGFAGALLPASNSVANARTELQTARMVLETPVPVENKIDWPTAYEAAKRSLSVAQTSVSQADEQVSHYTTATQLLGSYSQTLSGVNASITAAQGAWSVIETYHASSTWGGTSNNVQEAQSQVRNSEIARDNAQRAIGAQQFADAESQAQAAVSALNGASELCRQVVNLKDDLEDYRSWWPSKASAASSTIDSNRSQVQQYGSYDYGAKSSFDSAVSSLAQAYVHANAREYEMACSLADQALSSASGTGQRAENAYDDEMDRQRRAAEEAAERAAEAAEEAARRVQEESSSPSYGYDGGYDDGGYDSGGYDDGGGYDSGGYDDGGGY